MNILEAIEAMRSGAKVRRSSSIGATVSKCWLMIEAGMESDPNDDDKTIEVDRIYFCAAPITKEGGWVAETAGTCNPWTPQQSDLFADDFVEL